MTRPDTPTWRPTPAQTLLIRAALGDGERARTAFVQWVTEADLTALDAGSQRVLPLLYWNLQRLGVSHPILATLRRHYRTVWARNQLAMHHLEETLAAFAAQGIDTLVLKGAAMLLRYYKDSGLRPMGDFDVLVPKHQTEMAFAVLEKAGWQSKQPLHLLPEEHRAPFHGVGYAHPSKPVSCDLHWHLMYLNLAERYDAPLWAAAEPLQVGSVQSRTLCAEHHLIRLFFNGCVNEDGNNLRWLPDALMVLRHEPGFQWDRFVAYCQLLEFVEPVLGILHYLRDVWEVDVPERTIQTLAKTRVRYSIHKAYEGFNTLRSARNGPQVFWILYGQYQLSFAGAHGFFPLDFVRFLRHRWALEGGFVQTLKYAWRRSRGESAEEARGAV